MDHNDGWPDGILEQDLDSTENLNRSARRDARQIARDVRNMNALLSAVADRVSEGLPAVGDGHPAPAPRQPSWKKLTLAPLAAAAVVAALILVRGEGMDEGGGPDPYAGAPSTANMMAEMDVEADKPFVIFPTSDPDIAVVWLLNPMESD